MERDEAQDARVYVLTDAYGEEVPCELLDRLSLKGREYVILRPLNEDDSVMIYRVDAAVDGTESFTPETDEDVNEDVFDYFRASFDGYEYGDAE